MLKNIIYRYFTLFLALIVLLSSAGVGLVQHECIIKGKSVDLVFKVDKKRCNLCVSSRHEVAQKSDSSTPVFKKISCCTEKQLLKVVEYQTTAQKLNLENSIRDSSPLVLPGLFCFESFSQVVSSREDLLPATTFSFTSPYYGRSLLSFVQQLLI